MFTYFKFILLLITIIFSFKILIDVMTNSKLTLKLTLEDK